MPEILRTRDVVLFTKGATMTVAASSAMISQGWAGGQGVAWADSPSDEFMVTFADGGRGAGYVLWGHDEVSDRYTAITGQQVAYGYVTIVAGSSIMSTVTYERYTYASRLAGPLVEIDYTPPVKLYWSLRGYFTTEDEWTLSGDPRAPNVDPVGFVTQKPTALTNYFLTLQTTL